MNIWKHRRLIAMAVFDLFVVFAVLFANHFAGLVGVDDRDPELGG